MAALAQAHAVGLAPELKDPGRPAVTIELRPQISAQESTVRLGDVAFLTTPDLPLLRRLMALPLGMAPRVGEPAVLDKESLARWVQTRVGLVAQDADFAGGPTARWTGAEQTVIERSAQQVSGEDIASAARTSLQQWLSERSVRSDVQVTSAVRDLDLPTGKPTLRVRPLAALGRPAKRMLVWVEAWVDDRFIRTVAVSFEVSAWAPMSVANAPLDRGTPLDPIVLRAAFDRRDVDMTTTGASSRVGNTPTDRVPADAVRLRRPLRAGDVLSASNLEQAPAVARGRWAQLQVHSGEVSVQSRVEVLQDGRAGDLVRVKVPGSSAAVLARVAGPGQVELQP